MKKKEVKKELRKQLEQAGEKIELLLEDEDWMDDDIDKIFDVNCHLQAAGNLFDRLVFG